MLLQYCEYYPGYDKCKQWLEKNLPDMFNKLMHEGESFYLLCTVLYLFFFFFKFVYSLAGVNEPQYFFIHIASHVCHVSVHNFFMFLLT